jgi:adenylate cyclase
VAPDPVERKLAAILSADVVGYSRLMAEDEVATLRTLTAYREEIGVLVRQHRGRVVDSPGDNLLAEFPSALEAVSCAVEIQRVVAARNASLPSEKRMEFRIGVHLGDVMVEGDRIYGDGVNIAARLEGLAEAGGICISSTVHEQVQRKLDLSYEDLGKQDLKNIADPVLTYRIRLGSEAAIPRETLPGMDDLTVPGFGGRPAIAVLPFDNLSGDPEQEYFADGIAEDLITRLSTFRWFPVIARNSSFAYKGKSPDVKEVSRELGVRYVVEGSVRKAGDRVRISAQLIDATTGGHVWAERYDRELEDIFAVQDEITEVVAGSVAPELRRFERDRAARKEPQNLDAWDRVQRGFWHFNRLTREDNTKARSLFESAADLDPHLSTAFTGLAWTLVFDIIYTWTDSPTEAPGELLDAAQRSVALDEKDSEGQVTLGAAYAFTGQQDKAIAALELAVQLNPSSAFAHTNLGLILARGGRPDDAIASHEKAIRLSPQDPMMWMFFFGMAMAHFVAGRYEEAVNWAQRSVQRRADFAVPYRFLAASYAHLGRLDEARTALEESLRLTPEFSLTSIQLILLGADPDFARRMTEGLRKAGLKE